MRRPRSAWSTGTFEWEDGSTGTIAEVLPYSAPMYSIPDEILDVPEEVAALPNLMGFGNMHDLRQTMVRDESGALRGLVEQYAAEKDPRTALEQLWGLKKMMADDLACAA